mgnify:CR=1 FL=1
MGRHLKELRESLHLTQSALGHLIGLSQQVISRIECNIETITTEQIFMLADFYNVSTDYILDRSHQKRNSDNWRLELKEQQAHYELVQSFSLLNADQQDVIWAVISKFLEQEARR